MQDKLKNNLYKAIKTLNSNFRKITTPQTPPKTLEPPKITDPKPQPTELQTTKTIIEIKPITAFKTTLYIILAISLSIFIFQITNIILLFLLSFLIAAAMDPLVDLMQKKHLPRALSVTLIYIFSFFIIALIFSQLIPILAKQLIDITTLVGRIVSEIPNYDLEKITLLQPLKPYIQQLYQTIDIKTVATQLQQFLELISSQILSWGNNLWNVFLAVSNGLMNLIIVLIMVFFMTVDESGVQEMFISAFPNRHSTYISRKIFLIKETIGHWIRGQLNVSLSAFILTFIALTIAQIDYALTLSLIAGISMLIPVFGRVFAYIIALPIVLNQSGFHFLWLSISYFIIAQIENNVLVPYFMNKAVGLHPLIITFALLVGSQYLGIIGLVMAIPTATIIAIFVKEYTDRNRA